MRFHIDDPLNGEVVQCKIHEDGNSFNTIQEVYRLMDQIYFELCWFCHLKGCN